jgi:hypothetical protein
VSRKRAGRQGNRSAVTASTRPPPTQVEPHLPPSPNDAARGDPKRFIEQVDATVARRVEALVDMLAWVRIEMAATHPDGIAIAAPSDHERLQRALVQIEMALAMTKQLATELRRQQRNPHGE